MTLVYEDLINMSKEEAIKVFNEAEENDPHFRDNLGEKEDAVLCIMTDNVSTAAGNMEFWEEVIEAKYNYSDREVEIMNEYAEHGYKDYSGADMHDDNYGGLLLARLVAGKFDEIIEVGGELDEFEMKALRDYCGDPGILVGKGVIAEIDGEEIMLDSEDTIKGIWDQL